MGIVFGRRTLIHRESSPSVTMSVRDRMQSPDKHPLTTVFTQDATEMFALHTNHGPT